MTEWTSVEDRLPEPGKTVRVYHDSSCVSGFADAIYRNIDSWRMPGSGRVIPNVVKWRELETEACIADNNGWISVGERLPEGGQCVLISWENLGICAIALRKGDWWSNQWNSSVWSKSEAITHWQPLPVPPVKAGPFYIEQDIGERGELFHREDGFICTLHFRGVTEEVCETLNALWRQKGDKDGRMD